LVDGEPASFQDGFKSRSHAVAHDDAAVELQCGMLVWDEPRNMAQIDAFLTDLIDFLRKLS